MSVLAPGSFLRASVIRGDVASLGAAGLLLGIGLLISASAGVASGVGPLVGAAVSCVAGLALLQWSRQAWRGLLVEVTERYRAHDPGPSPVPWIDDALWVRVNRFDPEVDAHVVLMAEVDPMVKAFGQDDRGALTEPVLRPVRAEEKELARVEPLAGTGGAPEPGDAPTLLEQLASTPGRFLAVGARWPVCCGRLSTLESVRQADRASGALYLPETFATVDPWDASAKGQHGFQCRACGRRYATDPAW